MAWDTNFRVPSGSFFSSLQYQQLEALFRAILPRDPQSGIPGAQDCGAARFLDQLLQRDQNRDGIKIHQDLDLWKERYPIWLAALDSAAHGKFGHSLVQISEDQASELLSALENRAIPSFGTPEEQQRAFDTLWRHCLQGCWSDPRWGGNRDGVMWRWLGYLQAPQRIDLS